MADDQGKRIIEAAGYSGVVGSLCGSEDQLESIGKAARRELKR